MLVVLLRERTMSSSERKQTKIKFLLDENVKKRLLIFLKSRGFDTIFKPKGLSNGKLAELSKLERRVFVTNDWDFADKSLYSKSEIFSIIWLRIPQDKPEALINAFSLLLKEKTSSEDFEGKLIILYEDKFEIELIPSSSSAA